MTGATKNFKEAAKIIALVFEPINLTLNEIKMEKKRVKSEKREECEEYSIDYFTQKIVWENTSLANTIYGKNKVIDKIGIRALQAVHNQICSPVNLFFYVTGCFNNEDIAYLDKCVESYSLTGNEIRQNIAPAPGNFFKRNGQIEVKNSYYHYIRFSFDIDTTRYSYAELDLLFDILFSGDNSKIYLELSENSGYIYDFDARLERYNNLGNLYFSFEIEKKNILSAIQKVIDLLCNIKRAITDELECIVPFYTDNAESDLDDPEKLNWNMAYECHIMQNSYKSIDEKKKEYQCVTPTRMMEIAKEIFIKNNMIVTLKTDKKTFNLEEARAIIEKL
jgi:predicted Zn-dependent peptidase